VRRHDAADAADAADARRAQGLDRRPDPRFEHLTGEVQATDQSRDPDVPGQTLCVP
jgi:hypothetical protein